MSLDLFVRLGVQGQEFVRGMQGAQKSLTQLNDSVGRMESGLKTLKNLAATAFAGWGVKELGQSFIEAGIGIQRMKVSLEAALQSEQRAGLALKFLREESKRLGLVYQDQVVAYAQLAASAQGTALQGQKLKDVYSGLVEAAVALQLPQDKVNLAIYAMQQMMAKGIVMSEEFKRQLGDQIPGALTLGARAMGVNRREFLKLLEGQKIYADEFLPNFAKALREQFGGALEKATKNLQQNINRMKNSWFELRTTVMEAGVTSEISKQISSIAEATNDWIKTNDELLKQKVPEYILNIKAALQTIWDFTSVSPSILKHGILGVALLGVATSPIARMIALAGGILHLATAIENISKAMGLISAGVKIEGLEKMNFQELDEYLKNVDKLTKGGVKTYANGMIVKPFPKEEYQEFLEEQNRVIEKAANELSAEEKAAMAKKLREAQKFEQELLKYEIEMAKRYDDAVIDGYEETQKAIKQMTENNVDFALLKWFDFYDKSTKEYLDQIEAQEDAYKRMVENIQNYTADIFYDMFMGNVDSWEDMLRSMKSLFARYMAEMAAKALAEPILMPIVQGVIGGVAGSIFGSSSQDPKLAGLGLAGYSSSVKSFMNKPFGAFGMSSSLGGMLGGAGLGSIGYSLGGMFGLPQGGQSNIGSMLGGAAGSFLGPWGIAGGSLLGGLIGSAFGGKDEYANYKSAGRMLNFGVSSGNQAGGLGEIWGGSWLQDSFDRAVMGQMVPAVDALMSATEKTIKILPDTIQSAMMASLAGGISMPGANISRENAAEDIAKWIETIAGSITSEVYSAAVKAGFESEAAFDTFVQWITAAADASSNVMGTAFRNSLMNNDFVSFREGLKDAVFNSVSEGLINALMMSETFQGVLSPLFYGVQNAIDQAFVGGVFDADVFNQVALPYLSQLNTIMADFQPAFDMISGAIMSSREAIYEGTAANTGLPVSAIAGYSEPTATTNVTINVNGLLSTADAAMNLDQILQYLKDYNWGSINI